MSQLPKPLSDKTISRMLSKWDPKKTDILHDFYLACSNLYGVIELGYAWDVFKTFYKGIRKYEFMDFSDIARREDLPYYILEIDEVYTEERRKTEERLIINKKLVNSSYYKFIRVYDVMEKQNMKPTYIPEDIMAFTKGNGVELNLSWKGFCSMFRFIKAPNGMPLCKYKHYSRFEQFEIDYYKKESVKARLKADFDRPVSDKILEYLMLDILQGEPFHQSFSRLLNQYDIRLSEKELKKSIDLLMDANNTSNLWINMGWTPYELLNKTYDPSDPPVITFGSGIMKAIENGELDKEELEKGLDGMGIKYRW